jgi:Domain of unknown function (DUF4270)
MIFMSKFWWEKVSSLINFMKRKYLIHTSLKRLGLFSFLIGTIGLASCTKETVGVGGALVPNSDEVVALETDTFQISTKMVWVDSVRTDRLGANGVVLIGSYEDNQLGRTSCAANIQFDRIASSDTIPFGISVMRVELDLAVYTGAYRYGDLRNMQYRVEALQERLEIDTAYYATDRAAHANDNLVTHETGLASGQTISELDATKNILRLPLQKELGQFLLAAGSTVLNDKDAFRDYFKGLRISTSTTSGVVARYDLGSVNTRIRVYYSLPSNPLQPLARNLVQYVDFGVSTSSGTAGHSEFFTEIERDLSQTNLNALVGNGEQSATTELFFQNGMIACEVDYSSVQNFMQTESIQINNVDLVVPVVQPLDKERPNSAYLVTVRSIENVRNFYSAERAFFSVVNAYAYSKATAGYRMDVTGLIRASQADPEVSSSFFVFPTNSVMGVSQIHAAGPSYDPMDQSKNLRLILTYSKRIEND